jgi:hypothetical protein
MRRFLVLAIGGCALISGTACTDDGEASPGVDLDLANSTVLSLKELKANPAAHQWFDFRPNVKKLILAGAAETEHVAILWYTTMDGGVGLHYHAKTESVYVIDGTQTDGKGVYTNDTVYFNPPGSGHEIKMSSGFFLLAYAAPPDFAMTSSIGEYTPVRIDTGATDLTTASAFQKQKDGVRVFPPALDAMGGLSAELIEVTANDYLYGGNYLLVLDGSCDIQSATLGEDMLVVSKTVRPQPYRIAATAGSTCLVMGLSF